MSKDKLVVSQISH